MRTFRLLCVLLFVLTMGGIAVGQDASADSPKQPAQSNDSKPVPPSNSTKPVNPLQDGQTFTYRGLPYHFDKKTLRLVPDFGTLEALNSATTDCLVMHTIQVRRDEKYTDSNRIVSVTDCTPAKRFEMKSAVATPNEK